MKLESKIALIAVTMFLASCAQETAMTLAKPAPAKALAGATEPEFISASDPLLAGLPLPDKEIRWVRNDGKYEEQRGNVSHYRQAHEKTASGERYRHDAMAAAHRTLPFFTIVRCTRTDTGDSVIVIINDRGPFVRGRILDVTPAAAAKLDLHDDGIAPCRIEVIAYPEES